IALLCGDNPFRSPGAVGILVAFQDTKAVFPSALPRDPNLAMGIGGRYGTDIVAGMVGEIDWVGALAIALGTRSDFKFGQRLLRPACILRPENPAVALSINCHAALVLVAVIGRNVDWSATVVYFLHN